MQFRHLAARHRALSRQCLHAAGQGRHGDAGYSGDTADAERPGDAGGSERRGAVQTRPGHFGRLDRLRQINHHGRHAGLAQRTIVWPHHHGRRPGRVCACPQELRCHPARSRAGHRQLGSGPEKFSAASARCDFDGRNPRPRHHGACTGFCRNRPPVPGHAACQQRQSGAGPDHQLFPGRAPDTAFDGFVAQPQSRGVAATRSQAGQQGPLCSGRDHAQFAPDFRPDLQGRCQRDQGDHEEKSQHGDADLRPGAV